MHLTAPLSRYFDPATVVAPERRGAVSWSQFNQHYERLQHGPWSRINDETRYPWPRRLMRLAMAWSIQRSQALLDLRTKARVLRDFPLKRDPDIVFFGAEVGWEALLVQALFGNGGRVVLVDCDPAAYQRFLNAPPELRVPAPPGWPEPDLVLRRDPDRITYLREDFFDAREPGGFDVGIDWGLIEHFQGDRRQEAMRCFQRWLRPGGLQISAVPRDAFSTRLFYELFSDELNFGHRELMTAPELATALASGGFEPIRQLATPTTCIALSRVRT